MYEFLDIHPEGLDVVVDLVLGLQDQLLHDPVEEQPILRLGAVVHCKKGDCLRQLREAARAASPSRGSRMQCCRTDMKCGKAAVWFSFLRSTSNMAEALLVSTCTESNLTRYYTTGVPTRLELTISWNLIHYGRGRTRTVTS